MQHEEECQRLQEELELQKSKVVTNFLHSEGSGVKIYFNMLCCRKRSKWHYYSYSGN
jgi:hypothetical protein